ncbi:DAK2 domain-containing protein [Olsenella sp. YH-ols2217]|uniref:DAK2 domain-containing protein n=1 Tax=Kribbibacterium absianum TaxID=3044210 RepID=A0ABT6ZIE6_9ACTN|nr:MULTISPECIES: DAK2 domain-containing protein [unclassified Olsenella]MDJ1121334.1 DAK2 domain-containing protein [Olsenella sp. YH-ols2216]MDJ1128824.1 DAK2 domain-containing protein [Olsenella sp. YH-ols2217]
MIVTVLRHCLPIAAQAVADRADEINKLNVFPVPDGDTGTNMSLTLQTVVKEVEALPADADLQAVAKAVTHGSLMGARGNSGVITSQILRGVAEGLVDYGKDDPITTGQLFKVLRHAKHVAFRAVRKPVQGTILTVIEDLSYKAEACAKSKMTLDEALEAIVTQAYESVARTPDLLPVLKENGVVDSGAFGFAVFVEAFVNAYLGHDGTVDFKTTVASPDDAKQKAAAKVAIELNDDWEGSEYRYCTEFLFKALDADFDEAANLEYLASMGDCELLVGSNPDYKIHVHTNEPNKVLGHMLEQGQIYEVFIHNMDMEAQDRTAAIAEDQAAGKSEPKKALGFVAVAAGSGQAEILRSLGVDVVVQGGQTMNPSTADILAAIEKAHARQVIVLPDNSNIRMAAEAAASACEDSEVAVVPTRTVLQGFAAMFVVETDLPMADNVAAMTEAIAGIRDGEVTSAVRDSQAADGSPIKAGDVMGIQDDAITVVGSDVMDVCVDLLVRMQTEEEADTCTILAGEDMTDEDFEALCERIEDRLPDLELDPHRGEQSLYPVVFSLE